MGLLKNSLPEDFSVLTGDELEPEAHEFTLEPDMVLDDELPDYTDMAVNNLLNAIDRLESLSDDYGLSYFAEDLDEAHRRIQKLAIDAQVAKWQEEKPF